MRNFLRQLRRQRELLFAGKIRADDFKGNFATPAAIAAMLSSATTGKLHLCRAPFCVAARLGLEQSRAVGPEHVLTFSTITGQLYRITAVR